MGKKKVILIGDSLIEWFDWAGRFPEHEVHNLGISGETVEWMLDRLPRVIQSYPGVEKVFILTGINNVAMEDSGIVKPYRQALREFRAAYPQAELYVISLLPTRLPWIDPTTIRTLNERLRDLARENSAIYIDMHSVFSLHDLSELLSEDGIHISPSGYAVFSAELARHMV
jgi:lysophospholipase L1-like esterase